MAINVNGANSNIQVIQSSTNRKRILEQQQQNQNAKVDVLNNQLPERSRVKANDKSAKQSFNNNEEMFAAYEKAKAQFVKVDDKALHQNVDMRTQSQLSAYSSVSNMQNRDKLQSMLGVSVYA